MADPAAGAAGLIAPTPCHGAARTEKGRGGGRKNIDSGDKIGRENKKKIARLESSRQATLVHNRHAISLTRTSVVDADTNG